MQAMREFRYFDPEHKRSVVVAPGEALPERAINILGGKKVEQMMRTKHLSAQEATVVVPPKRKRGRPRKGG